ncbi:MAG: hypothetical protein M9899_03685 [Bdellovibrionaceae bacterium]|nr:hypothetical protein [Pseudobdellovibrionaceae bacterium]
MTSVFLLTSVAAANDPHFAEAQKFFYESKQLQQKGVKAAPPATKYNIPPSAQARYATPTREVAQHEAAPSQITATVAPQPPRRTAIYLSFINEKYGGTDGSPSLRTSLGLAIPIVNASGGRTKGEFVLLSDIRGASDWGRVRFYHRESINIIRWNFTQLEAFVGAGLGYGYGDMVGPSQKLFAPWMAGVFFNQIHKEQPVFYRFEIGLTGDLSFGQNAHSSGFFGNISLGYKL